MNTQDKRISELYTELFDNAHASSEFRGKVRTMTEVNKKRATRITFKAICAVAAAAVLIVAGGAIASASKGYKGVYDTVIFNGEEVSARYGKFGDDTSLWQITENGIEYSVFVYGEFDIDNDILYIEDRDSYIIASTEPNPTLNLYTDIDKASRAEITDEDGESWLKIYNTDDSGHFQKVNLTWDINDDELDGALKLGLDENFTFTVLSNGSIAEAYKEPALEGEEGETMWGVIWGEEDPSAMNEFYSSEN